MPSARPRSPLPCLPFHCQDLDTIFIATNVKGRMALEANPDRALTRFEFMECIVRVAAAKYVKSKRLEAASDAMAALLEEHVRPHAVFEDPDEFREKHLFTEEVRCSLPCAP